MVKITCVQDLEQISDIRIVPYIKNLIQYLLKEYKDDCPNGSIETIGAIYFISSTTDFDNYLKFELTNSISKSNFEWIEYIDNEFINSCIVLNDDRAINIIGKTELFEKYLED